MSRLSKLATWLNSEVEKDKNELESDKQRIIKEITSLKKDELFKKEKLTFWQRLKKVLS